LTRSAGQASLWRGARTCFTRSSQRGNGRRREQSKTSM
jgi:hypothetical protein